MLVEADFLVFLNKGLVVSDRVNLGVLEGLSYGWHHNVNDVKLLRLLKALKVGVEAIFGRFKVSVSDPETLRIVREEPNAWFSLSVEMMRQACKLRPVRVPNRINDPLSNHRRYRESGQERVGDLKASQVDIMTKNINEREDVNSIDQAIDIIERRPLLCDHLKHRHGVFDGFFTKCIKDDVLGEKKYHPFLARLMRLGFSPLLDSQKNKIEKILNNMPSETELLVGISDNAEKLIELRQEVDAAQGDHEKIDAIKNGRNFD